MSVFKSYLMPCQQCGKSLQIKEKDFLKGEIVCLHQGCGFVNKLTESYFDENIMNGLPHFGKLVYKENPSIIFKLKKGLNILGRSATCDIQLQNFQHQGECYISNRHATIEVFFDKWKGQLRYLIQDGAFDINGQNFKNSLNGTYLNGILLKISEKIDAQNQNTICLGGKDVFELYTYQIPEAMLQTYKTTQIKDNDATE